MNDDLGDHLKSLHTSAIDARAGYEEALKQADSHGLNGLFQDMITLHTTNATELEKLLVANGEEADDSGSFMSTVHRTIMDIRSLFSGLDASVLSGLIDGETRNVHHYEKVLTEPGLPADISGILQTQKSRITAAIATMKQDEKAHSA